eukprot:CAMPEP_0196727244 /NCGR_PEP_ID=MMETSP1091-20130531/8280_1 /TAXON_ID=302021 /ORGANISM="Rhodomonas sp., Strain CCMP768" /LENGTH=70 /DNA_ID=CAMNT_0042069799 /DNA_START=45 /DNA_END=257 /DNA_ORIENTATION=+
MPAHAAHKAAVAKKAVPHQPKISTRIMEACAVKMFRSSLGPNSTDAQSCLKKYDHAKESSQLAFLKKYGA